MRSGRKKQASISAFFGAGERKRSPPEHAPAPLPEPERLPKAHRHDAAPDGPPQSSPASAPEHQWPESDATPDPQSPSSPDPTHSLPDPASRPKFLAQKLTSASVKESSKRQHMAEPGIDYPPNKLTPLEQQVVDFKRSYNDTLLMFEVGYKLRFFGQDAECAAESLGVMCFPDRNFLTASVPTVRSSYYVRRLVQCGYKVGVVGQAETAAVKAQGPNRQGLFERKLTALHTRATLEAGEGQGKMGASTSSSANDTLDSISSRLVCIAEGAGSGTKAAEIGVLGVDTSTGDVAHTTFEDGQLRSGLESTLLCLEPCEVLIVRPVSTPTERLIKAVLGTGSSNDGACVRIEDVHRKHIQTRGAVALLREVLERDSSNENGHAWLGALQELSELTQDAAAAVASHLRQHGQQEVLAHSASVRRFGETGEMSLPPNALRQLEVVQGSKGDMRGSLLEVLDRCRTPMGHRLMRHWVTHPLKDAEKIEERLEAVDELLKASEHERALSKLSASLCKLPDLERGITRALHGTASPSEVFSTLSALSSATDLLNEYLGDAESSDKSEAPNSILLCRLFSAVCSNELQDCVHSLLNAIDHKAAKENNKISLFQDDTRYPDVAKQRNRMQQEEEELEEMLPDLAKQAGVSELKYITFQGTEYCIEIPQNAKFPARWPKISSNKGKGTVTCQPTEVAHKVEQRDACKERLTAAAHDAWIGFLSGFSDMYGEFRHGVSALATLDCLVGLADLASTPDYTRPRMVAASEGEGGTIDVERGRHPVLESTMAEGAYVPNSTNLNSHEKRCEVITGPNMGGKSCYMRQVALICIMAQIGSFVPADRAKLSAMDGIFTRMGAADSLALGTSTFLEEMSEASRIVRHASCKSLVVLDELGRGTAALDGQAIADACLSYLIAQSRCITLFATHYQGVARQILQQFSDSAIGRHASYVEQDKGIAFVYALSRGITDNSFGLNAARMAGLPEHVLSRAQQKAKEIECCATANEGHEKQAMEVLQATESGNSKELEHCHKRINDYRAHASKICSNDLVL